MYNLSRVVSLSPRGFLPVGCAQKTFSGGHLGVFLSRCSIHINWLTVTWRSSGRTLSSSLMSELLSPLSKPELRHHAEETHVRHLSASFFHSLAKAHGITAGEGQKKVEDQVSVLSCGSAPSSSRWSSVIPPALVLTLHKPTSQGPSWIVPLDRHFIPLFSSREPQPNTSHLIPAASQSAPNHLSEYWMSGSDETERIASSAKWREGTRNPVPADYKQGERWGSTMAYSPWACHLQGQVWAGDWFNNPWCKIKTQRMCTLIFITH